MSAWIRATVARIAAVVVAGLVTFLAGTLGLEVTPEAQIALTEAVTALGVAIFLLGYAAFRPLLSRYIHPSDTSEGG